MNAGQEVKATLFPITMAGSRLGVRLHPPRRGEHSQEILAGLGYDSDRIRALMKQLVVA